MLKIVEYGILAVSLLTILGLVLGNMRSRPVPLDENAARVPPGDTTVAPLGSAKQP